MCRITPIFLCPQHTIASKGRGIMAMDESNATCGKRLESIGELAASTALRYSDLCALKYPLIREA